MMSYVFNRFKIDLRYFGVVLFLLIFSLKESAVYGQFATEGNLFIPDSSELVVDFLPLYFLNSASGSQPGVIGTERSKAKGYISFTASGTISGASNNFYIDGYAKSYASTPLLLPIGDNGQYRPVLIGEASSTQPISAAYFGVSPSSAITSSLKGGNEDPLPLGAPFNITRFGANVAAVDSTGYWDIDGTFSTKISLSWSPIHQVSLLCNNDLSNLTMVGWDGNSWVEIPSSVDVASLWGSNSSLSQGSISSTNTLIPDTYKAYALASRNIFFEVNIPDTLLFAALPGASIGPSLTPPSTIRLTNSLIGPKNGSASISSSGVVTFIPQANYVGVDTIYRIICPNGNKCDTSLIIVMSRLAPDTSVLVNTSGGSTTIGDSIVSNRGTVVRVSILAPYPKNGKAIVNANGTVSYTSNPGYTGKDTIKRVICVVYSNGVGRCDTLISIISVNSPLIVSNYISPNGDGVNDVWNLDPMLAIYPNLKAIVYNRWGNIVWRSTGSYGKSNSGSNVWYGQLEGKQDNVPDGVYYYILELQDQFNTTKTGFIEVMRQ